MGGIAPERTATHDYSVQTERWPITGGFVISRETKTDTIVVTVTLRRNGFEASGECVPLRRYDQTAEGEMQAISAWLDEGHALDRATLVRTMPARPARFALDTALWQLEAQEQQKPLWQLAGFDRCPPALPSAFTLSGAAPEIMAERAREHQEFRWIKLKLLGDGLDQARLCAVHEAVPHKPLIVDANEGLTGLALQRLLPVFGSCNVVLIEQPLPAGQDELLSEISSPIPLAADESCHTIDDLEKLAGKYQVVNLKLDKTGGLTHALSMKKRAEEMGFLVMVGCMVSTSLSILPAFLLGQNTAFTDLDGALLLEKDRPNSKLSYHSGEILLLE